MIKKLFHVNAIYNSNDAEAIAQLETDICNAFTEVGWSGTKDVSTTAKTFTFTNDNDVVNNNSFILTIDRSVTTYVKWKLDYVGSNETTYAVVAYYTTTGIVDLVFDVFKLSKGGMTFRPYGVADGIVNSTNASFFMVAFKEGEYWRYIVTNRTLNNNGVYFDDGDGIVFQKGLVSSKTGYVTANKYVFVPVTVDAHNGYIYNADIYFLDMSMYAGSDSNNYNAFVFEYNNEKYLHASFYQKGITGYQFALVLKLAEEVE